MDNVDDSWNLAMYVACGIVEGIWTWMLWVLELWEFDAWAWLNKPIFDACENFVGMCKSYFISMKIFMGMGMENFCGGMDFYVGYGIFFFFFLTWDFFLVMEFGHGEFFFFFG